MTHIAHSIGIASQIGGYSDAIETRPDVRWLFTSGTPGLSAVGALPKDIAGQAELAWRNILEVLKRARVDVRDIAKVTQYLTRAADVTAYSQVRGRFLGEARPASMLLVIPRLVWPDILVEIEHAPRASWLEIHPENYMTRGPALEELDRIADAYALSCMRSACR